MGYSISNRVFGSDIPKPIKQKLALRQALSKTADFGEAQQFVGQNYPSDGGDGLPYYRTGFSSDDGKAIADLSSRTPFARMWVCVVLFKENSEESESTEFNLKKGDEVVPEMPDPERRKKD